MPSVTVEVMAPCPKCGVGRKIRVKSAGDEGFRRQCFPCRNKHLRDVQLARAMSLRTSGTNRAHYAQLKTPPKPTEALPGTPEKIQVMRDRVSGGYKPHHPRDPRIENPAGCTASAAAWRPVNAPEAEDRANCCGYKRRGAYKRQFRANPK